MPLLRLETSVPVPEHKRAELLARASRIVATVSGKPEAYMMVSLSEGSFCMGGDSVSAAFVDVRGIGGLTPDVNGEISRQMCQLLEKDIGIPSDKVYLNFTDVPAKNWGWKGSTFG